MSQARLDGRLAIVTGASRGLGRATALAYAEAGAHVIAVARTVGALEELDDAIAKSGGAATLVPLDLTDGAGIDNLGAAVAERWGRLDILFHAAATLGPLTPVGHLDEKNIDRLIATNLKPVWRLIRAFDPLLQQSLSGRGIFVTSSVGSTARAFWGGYAMTKAALERIVEVYAAEQANGTVNANILDPGRMRTGMRAEAFPGEDPETLPDPVSITPLCLAMAAESWTRTGQLTRFRDWKDTAT